MDYNATIGIDIVEHDDLVVVAVEGEVDLSAAALFEESLAIADATDAATIVVDLDRVSFMDSAGVQCCCSSRSPRTTVLA
jgi:anti-anti-sigma factor